MRRKVCSIHNDKQTPLQHVTRDLADAEGNPLTGSANCSDGTLPSIIATTDTISRTTTVSAAVFHGVRPGEDPSGTTMWTLLGDPKLSIAVPCWAKLDHVAGPLEGSHGGEIGEIARLLRDSCLTSDRTGVFSAGLPGIWNDLWPLEREFLKLCLDARETWASENVSSDQLTALHDPSRI